MCLQDKLSSLTVHLPARARHACTLMSMLVIVKIQHATQAPGVARLVIAIPRPCKHQTPQLRGAGENLGHTLMGRRLALQLQLRSLSCQARSSPSCAIRKSCMLAACACEASEYADKAPAWLHCRPVRDTGGVYGYGHEMQGLY